MNMCIFCGGETPAPTTEHCPPRSLFLDRRWPEGFSFPACHKCNNGTADDDQIFSVLALAGELENSSLRSDQAEKALEGFSKKDPNLFDRMFEQTSRQGRRYARELGISPAKGQTYRDLPLLTITEEVHRSVGVVAGKLTKAIYFRHQSRIFPKKGGILFHWSTNADKLAGRKVALEAFGNIKGEQPLLVRDSKKLNDQFSYIYSSDETQTLHLLRADFGSSFGFITAFSQEQGRMESLLQEIIAQTNRPTGPLKLINGLDTE
jgi:hypothetical protein